VNVILHPTEYPPGPGGIGVHAWNVARGLSARGWRVHVVTPQPGAEPDEIEAFNRGEPYRVSTLAGLEPPWREGLHRLGAVLESADAARRSGAPTIMVASGQRALWVTAAAAATWHAPWVAVAHGTELDSRVGWQRRLTGWALRRAGAVASVSRFTAGYLPQYGIEPSEVSVIPNGADDDVFRPLPGDDPRVAALRRDLDLGPGPVLLTVGNLTERKGQDVVVRALPAVLEELPGAVYLMVGLPTRERELRELAGSLGVSHAVCFAGRVDQDRLVAACSLADLFLMTSRHTAVGDFEGFGIAVVEAALCGTPAVVSGGSGLEEAVAGDRTGLVVPQDDPGATAAAVLRLLGDRELLGRFSDAARARALAEQTWRRRVEQYAGLLARTASVVPDGVAR